MLQRITVHNLALIRDIEINFSSELNVFSGETGAGKSIIVDSLMLLVGARYDKSMIKFGADSGYVEGVFDFDDDGPLREMGIDCEDGIFIVTRKFYRDGKNDIRINGKQTTTAMLRELMRNYVDIYGQNEYQSLMKVTEQRKIVDHFVFDTDDGPLKKHRAAYDEYKKVCAELKTLGDETGAAYGYFEISNSRDKSRGSPSRRGTVAYRAQTFAYVFRTDQKFAGGMYRKIGRRQRRVFVGGGRCACTFDCYGI